jgi:hypothetical protein
LHLLVYLLEYMKMHGPRNIKQVNCSDRFIICQYYFVASCDQDLLRNSFVISLTAARNKPSARGKNGKEVVTRIHNRKQQEVGSTHIMRHVLGLNTVVFRLTCALVRGEVGWGTPLQDWRLWIRIPMGSFHFFIHLILPDALTLGSTQPPTEMSYLLTPRNIVLLEKINGFHLVKKFPAFYGTRTFITSFTSARHLSLSYVGSIRSMPHIPLPENTS